MHKNGGRDHVFRIDRTDKSDFLYFHDGRFSSHGHGGIEIPRGQAIGEIAELVGGLRLDQGVVGMNGRFENTARAVDDALFFSRSDFRAYAYGGVKTEQTRGGSAHPLAQNSLRDELERHVARSELFLKII